LVASWSHIFAEAVGNVNIKSMTVAGGQEFMSIFIGKRLGSSVGRAVD
jgi:hypothetical protein